MHSYIQSITLVLPDNKEPVGMGAEKSRAIADLRSEGFIRFNQSAPPYDITLSFFERQLVIKTIDSDCKELPALILSLSPYRSIIRDYFMMIESYEKMRSEETNQSKLEAVDMARRGLHNEAATMMMERLKDKLEMDHTTARRLFTLVCVLHMNQARLWTSA